MNVNDLLAKLDADLAAATAHVDELQQARDGFVFAVARYSEQSKTPAPTPQGSPVSAPASMTSTSYLGGPRLLKEVVLPVVRAAGGDIPTKDVYERVTATGRVEKYEAVRASLNYLKKRQEIWSVAPGVWTAIAPTNAEGPAVTGTSDGTPALKEGGESHETTENTASTAEDQRHPQLGASIAEVAS